MIKYPLPDVFPISRQVAENLLELMENYTARIMVVQGESDVCLQSLLGLITLCTKPPVDAELMAEGEDAEAALAAVIALLDTVKTV